MIRRLVILDGILVLNKKEGMTSHDCVHQLRKITHQKKIGHTGTLDPAAVGVLPICLGKATKIASYVTDYEKVYRATVTLGVATTTEDQEGEVIEEKFIEEPPSKKEIED